MALKVGQTTFVFRLEIEPALEGKSHLYYFQGKGLSHQEVGGVMHTLMKGYLTEARNVQNELRFE